jgi:hypothetical protein
MQALLRAMPYPKLLRWVDHDLRGAEIAAKIRGYKPGPAWHVTKARPSC